MCDLDNQNNGDFHNKLWRNSMAFFIFIFNILIRQSHINDSNEPCDHVSFELQHIHVILYDIP